MPRRSRREAEPELTGPDLLLAIADRAVEQDLPYTGAFHDMVIDAFSGDDRLAALVARRPLKDHENAPVSVILTAAEVAGKELRDPQAFREVLRVGLILLAKWPEYLVTAHAHPDLVPGENSPVPREDVRDAARRQAHWRARDSQRRGHLPGRPGETR